MNETDELNDTPENEPADEYDADADEMADETPVARLDDEAEGAEDIAGETAADADEEADDSDAEPEADFENEPEDGDGFDDESIYEGIQLGDEMPPDDFDGVLNMGAALDVDAALASVAALPDVVAERTAQEEAERARIEAEAQAREADASRRATHYFARPPRVALQRGRLSSVIPALVLIATGAWLTLTLTTSEEQTLETGSTALVIAGGLGLMMLAYWIGSGRWSRGACFGGLFILLSAAVLVFLTQDDTLQADGWPMLIVAGGVAALLTALLAQPTSGRLIFTGLALVVAGLLALFVVTSDTLLDDLNDYGAIMGGVALVATLILMALPVLAGRRG
jgi:hypothetical protein